MPANAHDRGRSLWTSRACGVANSLSHSAGSGTLSCGAIRNNNSWSSSIPAPSAGSPADPGVLGAALPGQVVLADQHEEREKDRFQRDDEGQKAKGKGSRALCQDRAWCCRRSTSRTTREGPRTRTVPAIRAMASEKRSATAVVRVPPPRAERPSRRLARVEGGAARRHPAIRGESMSGGESMKDDRSPFLTPGA